MLNATEKRRTVTPKRRFRPVVPKATAMHSPLPKTPPKPASNAAVASTPMMVRQDTPWPSTGKMSGNLFQDRNWLLPKDYLATEEKEEMAKPYPKEEDKMEEQDPKEEKCGWGAWMPSMPGTEERGQSSPSTGTNGKPTATETLTQTASDKAQTL